MADRRSRIDLQILGLAQLKELNHETYLYAQNLKTVGEAAKGIGAGLSTLNRTLETTAKGIVKSTEAVKLLGSEMKALQSASTKGAEGAATVSKEIRALQGNMLKGIEGAKGFSGGLTGIGSSGAKAEAALAKVTAGVQSAGKASITAGDGVRVLQKSLEEMKLTADASQGMMSKYNRSVGAAEKASLKLAGSIDALNSSLTRLRITATDGEGGLLRISNAGEKTAKGFSAQQKVLIGAGQGLLNVASGITVVGAASAKLASDFSYMTRTLANNTTMTTGDLDLMRQTILKLGSETGASWDQLANGFMHVANFGYRGADAVKILTEATKASVATNADAGVTAQLLAKVLHENGFQADFASKAINVLWYAAGNSDAKFTQLITTCGRVFAMTAQMGVGFQETAAVLSIFMAQGINASQATMQLQNDLTKIVHPTKAVQDELLKLRNEGADLTRDFSLAGLKAKGLGGIFQDVSGAAKQLGIPVDKLALKLFPNLRGTIGALIGTSSAGLGGLHARMGDINDILGGKSVPLLQKFADTMNEPHQKLQALINTIKRDFLPIGKEFIDDFIKMEPAIKGVATAIEHGMQWFNGLPTWLKEGVIWAGALNLAFTTLGGANLVNLIKMLGTLKIALAGVATAEEAAAIAGGVSGAGMGDKAFGGIISGLAKTKGLLGFAGGAAGVGGGLLLGGGALAYGIQKTLSTKEPGQGANMDILGTLLGNNSGTLFKANPSAPFGTSAAFAAAADERNPAHYATMTAAALKAKVATDQAAVAGLSYSKAAQLSLQQIVDAEKQALRHIEDAGKKNPKAPHQGGVHVAPGGVAPATVTPGMNAAGQSDWVADAEAKEAKKGAAAGRKAAAAAKRAESERQDAELRELDDQIDYAKAALAKLRRNYNLPAQADEYTRLATPYLKQLDSVSLKRAMMPPVDKDKLLTMTSGLGDEGRLPSAAENLELLRGYEKFNDANAKYQEQMNGIFSKAAFDAARAAQESQRAVARAEGDSAKVLELTYSGPEFTHSEAAARAYAAQGNSFQGLDSSLMSMILTAKAIPDKHADETVADYNARVAAISNGARPNNVFGGDGGRGSGVGEKSALTEELRLRQEEMLKLDTDAGGSMTEKTKEKIIGLQVEIEKLTKELQDLTDRQTAEAFHKMIEDMHSDFEDKNRGIERAYNMRPRGQGSGDRGQGQIADDTAKLEEVIALAMNADSNLRTIIALPADSPDYQQMVKNAQQTASGTADAVILQQRTLAQAQADQQSQQAEKQAATWMEPLKSGLESALQGKGKGWQVLLEAGQGAKNAAINRFLGSALDPKQVGVQRQTDAVTANTDALLKLTGTLGGGVGGQGSGVGGNAAGKPVPLGGGDYSGGNLVVPDDGMYGRGARAGGGIGDWGLGVGGDSTFPSPNPSLQGRGLNANAPSPYVLPDISAGGGAGLTGGSVFTRAAAGLQAAVLVGTLFAGALSPKTARAVTPENSPSYFNSSSAMDYYAYRERATGTGYKAGQIPGYTGPPPKPYPGVVGDVGTGTWAGAAGALGLATMASAVSAGGDTSRQAQKFIDTMGLQTSSGEPVGASRGAGQGPGGRGPGNSGTGGADPDGLSGLTKSSGGSGMQSMFAGLFGGQNGKIASGALQGLLTAYGIFSTGQQQGINLGNVLGGVASGAQTGSEIGAMFGAGPLGALVGGLGGGLLDVIGGLFHHSTPKAITPQNSPSYYNNPSAFDYFAYRYRATGQMPTSGQLPGYVGAIPKITGNVGLASPLVNVYMGGVQQSVTKTLSTATASNTVAQTSSWFDLHRPLP